MTPVRRVVLVIVEGLHPDAIGRHSLFNLKRIVDGGASALAGRSTSPSSRASSLISLCTGVHPERHGVVTNKTLFSRGLSRLEPLARTISNEGFQVSAFGPETSSDLKGRALLLGRELGLQHLTLRGATSSELVSAAINALCTQRRGLVVLRFTDCADVEAEGWESKAYAAACQRVDQSLGLLAALSGAGTGDSLLLVLGDHQHDRDRRLSLTLFGRCVNARTLEEPSLLDVAPTILWALGLPVPRHYEGRPLIEAFESARELARTLA